MGSLRHMSPRCLGWSHCPGTTLTHEGGSEGPQLSSAFLLSFWKMSPRQGPSAAGLWMKNRKMKDEDPIVRCGPVSHREDRGRSRESKPRQDGEGGTFLALFIFPRIDFFIDSFTRQVLLSVYYDRGGVLGAERRWWRRSLPKEM